MLLLQGAFWGFCAVFSPVAGYIASHEDREDSTYAQLGPMVPTLVIGALGILIFGGGVMALLERHKSWVSRLPALWKALSPRLLAEGAVTELGSGSIRRLALLPVCNHEELVCWVIAAGSRACIARRGVGVACFVHVGGLAEGYSESSAPQKQGPSRWPVTRGAPGRYGVNWLAAVTLGRATLSRCRRGAGRPSRVGLRRAAVVWTAVGCSAWCRSVVPHA
jgi:hypothetical protein